MPRFIPGLQLSRLFYQKEVKPILHKQFPNLRYSAAVIGWGSEVLGFDTPVSRDHHWGPRVLLFLSERDHPLFKDKISKAFANHLPYEFMGYSTNYSKPEPNGVRHPVKISRGPVNHMINIYTVRSFFKARLGIDPKQQITPADWLTLPQQRLLELTSGEVYHDGLGELEKVRTKLTYYPKDVWLYMLAAQWTRISQEEAFVGRAGHVGDELGSQVVAARLVREIIKLSFLLERKYAPYNKWLGSSFSKLKIAKDLTPLLRQVLLAKTWKTREKWLAKAYTLVAEQHNALRISKSLSTRTSSYYGRPYLVIFADRFARATKQAIKDPVVKSIKTDVGAIDQFTDSTNVVEDFALGKKLRAVY
ncbi:MAG TPA: DUF4037 domain-containing protein [Pyrinomonadaceae bacterium]|jgi:hypothetical protein|nr:DUF4037 domain-containing protein [Pyrinomonadaceae bacterium]